MELWIRSQDKLMLLKVDAFTISEDPNNQRGFGILDGYTVIGWYKSKERALEVLNEIQKILEQILDPNLTQLLSFVYEMPKE